MISTHLCSPDNSLSHSPSMDKDGAELKGTIGNTWHTKCLWFRIGFILHHDTELLQLQERGKELFMVSQMHQKLELQNHVV